MNLYTVLTIKEFDQSLFTKKYLADCMGCTFCSDMCCSYGCPADMEEVERISSYADKLEPILGIPLSGWFQEIQDNADFPSGKVRYTRVYDNKCVFSKKGYRGCTLHRFCIENGMDVHILKPMVCSLFPVTWENGRIMASEFLNELPCQNTGVTVFKAQKNELNIYLGDYFITKQERNQY